jgi:hypothetical protein
MSEFQKKRHAVALWATGRGCLHQSHRVARLTRSREPKGCTRKGSALWPAGRRRTRQSPAPDASATTSRKRASQGKFSTRVMSGEAR